MDNVMFGSLKAKDCVIFQCKICHSVLGDSLQCCGTSSILNALMCLRVTENVELDSIILIQGPLSECLYKSLHCSFCRAKVGMVPCSTTESLSHLRGLYCLDKGALHCYMLQSKSAVEVSDLNLEPQSLTQHIGELKRQIVVAHCRLMAAVKKLDELVGEESGLGSSILNLERGHKPQTYHCKV
uniref:protein Mis18-beta n=1 Tax=Pristiophorus japonicus TaxID=55135 RepID=UPI00398E9851